MMNVYQTECRETSFIVSANMPALTRCPFCSEAHISSPSLHDDEGQVAAMEKLGAAIEMEDTCLLNLAGGSSDVWFFVYSGKGNYHVCGYTATHDDAIQLALEAGFSGKNERIIDSWGNRPLEWEDFKLLLEGGSKC